MIMSVFFRVIPWQMRFIGLCMIETKIKADQPERNSNY